MRCREFARSSLHRAGVTTFPSSMACCRASISVSIAERASMTSSRNCWASVSKCSLSIETPPRIRFYYTALDGRNSSRPVRVKKTQRLFSVPSKRRAFPLVSSFGGLVNDRSPNHLPSSDRSRSSRQRSSECQCPGKIVYRAFECIRLMAGTPG